MTNEEYTILINELQTDPLGIGYANMSDDEVAAALNEPRVPVPTQRFVSLRMIAAVLDDSEYATLKAVVQTQAEQSPRVADMLRFLESPCDDSGTTGGLDFGFEGVRQWIESMPGLSDATKRKLLALGERLASRAEVLGLPQVYPGHINSARKLMGGS